MSTLFADPDVTAAQERGGRIHIGPLTVRLPRTFGFCGGVLQALRVLEDVLAEKESPPAWLLGEIIHNDTVNRFFRDKGVRMIPEGDLEHVFRVADSADVFVIPAFGVPRDLERRLRDFCDNDAQIVDTTCRYVRRIWRFVEDMAAAARTIVIHGKPDHPETRATLSRALTPGNTVVLLPDLAAADALAEAVRHGTVTDFPAEWVFNPAAVNFAKVAIVNQTTMLYQETRQIEDLIGAAVNAVGGNLARAATLCRATQDRQEAALELCRDGCDLVLVVGGFASSNTTQLYRLAKQFAPTYFVSDASALGTTLIRHFLPEEDRTASTPDWFTRKVREVVLLAGASCPQSDIGNVIRRLRQIVETAAQAC